MADTNTPEQGSGISRRGLLQTGAVAVIGGSFMPLSQAVRAAEGSVLTARSYADIDKLDPGFYQNAYNVDVMNCIYSKLVQYKSGHAWDWELQAAESIEQVDSTHIRFKLREGIMFTGGYGEMTAEDVKFSFERILEHDSPVKGDWAALERVDVEDKYTGVIVLNRPFQPLWNITLPYGAGHIVSKKAVMEATENGGDFGMNPPCFSGPYVLDEWKSGQHVKLKRNPDYTGPAEVGFDEVRILPMDDDKTAEIAYKSGDLDFTQISLASLKNFKQSPPAKTKIEEYPSLYYLWVGMNLDHPKLQDKNLRKAIQWAINTRQIVDAAYFGQAEPSTGIIAPGLVGHREEALIPPEGDLEKAKAFMAKAGVDSVTLTIDTLNATTFKTIAEVVQAQLKRIGVDLEINVQDSGSFWTLGMESEGDRWQKVQLIVNRFSMVPDPYYATQWFTCEQVGKWNWERFCNEEFDKLHKQAVEVADKEKRAELYHRMQDIMEESGAYRFVTHEGNPVVYRETVSDPSVRPDGRPLYRDFKTV
ncbi:peptide/nickel transport system substrate-binding protein [Limimonas halophila]|uniref:Peptide/nickel transport system substrate-binding protein n=1 Tax=Limimonas halophila TaxID=1082479 RepID=A0A1G7SY89_9PROT|nr:ABC transporter substrate-binding protein [Limimonas halophila]SDG28066.1 peptide/nickel transport system substrate-binding protein [Limimonas halophila]